MPRAHDGGAAAEGAPAGCLPSCGPTFAPCPAPRLHPVHPGVCTLCSPTLAPCAPQCSHPTQLGVCTLCSPTLAPCAPQRLHSLQPHIFTLRTPVSAAHAALCLHPVQTRSCTPRSSVFAPCAAPWQLSPILIPHICLQRGTGSVLAGDTPSFSSTGQGQPAYPEQHEGITDSPRPHPSRQRGRSCHRCHPESRQHPCHPHSGHIASPIGTQHPGKGMRPQEPRHGTNPGPSRDAGVLAPSPLAGTVPGRCQLPGPGGSASRVRAGKVLLFLLLLSLLSPDFELDNEGARLSERCWR